MNDGLRLRLSDDQQRQLVRHPTVDGDAYDLYLQARLPPAARNRRRLSLLAGAPGAGDRSRPEVRAGFAALSGNYAMMVTDGFERPTDAWPQVSTLHAASPRDRSRLARGARFDHAVAFLFDWDWAGAERARRRFLQIAGRRFEPALPAGARAERWALGRPDEALQLARRTRELDPLSPYLAILEADYLLRAGQFDAAIALYERSIGVDPENPNALLRPGRGLVRQGRFDEAIEARRRAHAVAGDDALEGRVGHGAWRAGLP